MHGRKGQRHRQAGDCRTYLRTLVDKTVMMTREQNNCFRREHGGRDKQTVYEAPNLTTSIYIHITRQTNLKIECMLSPLHNSHGLRVQRIAF